jgi:hypothetical protein
MPRLLVAPTPLPLHICEQRGIGTHLLIRGYVANEWTQLQDQSCKDANAASKLSATGEAWTRKLILYLWDEAFQLWDKRNKEIFESDDSSTRLFDLKQQVTELYALEYQGTRPRPIQRRYITHRPPQPINTLLYQLHNFVQIQGPVIRQSVKEAEKLAAANTNTLPELFTLRYVNPKTKLLAGLLENLRGPPAGLSRLEGDREWVVRPGSVKETLSGSAGP